MLKLLTIIGARPQIIKSAAISRAIKSYYSTKVKEVIVHTGQHYDSQMSAIFFEELQIPLPKYNLQVGSGKHGEQTAKMIMGIEEILEKEKPDFLVVYGDTNSTLAGAIAAAKIHIPIVHIEAGLRSYNKKMPEEVNRILTDHVSTFLFSPTITGMKNLQKEGFNLQSVAPFTVDNPGIFNVGDVMYDNSLFFAQIAAEKIDILHQLNVEKDKYVLVTIHRNNNTDDEIRLNEIFEAILHISKESKIVIPLHPRTLKQIQHLLDKSILDALNHPNILMIPPVSYLEMIQLEENSHIIITDSGGVQKEAYFFSKPCIILRSETEWTEIIESGSGILCDAIKEMIIKTYHLFVNKENVLFTNIYGAGDAAVNIINILLDSTHERSETEK